MMFHFFHQLVLFFCVACLVSGCSGGSFWLVDSLSEFSDIGLFLSENHPPNPPRLPIPENGSEEQLITVNMQWRGGDPDGDIVYYDVYFEADDPTPDRLVSYRQTVSYFDPGLLSYDTVYYWQIIAIDQFLAETAGPVWQFQTQAVPVPNLECDGKLVWQRVPAQSMQTGSFLVRNLGDPQSLLCWEIESFPSWGTWNLTPTADSNLTPELGGHTVFVSVEIPDERFHEFSGEVRVVNTQNRSDFDIIIVSVSTSFMLPPHEQTVVRVR